MGILPFSFHPAFIVSYQIDALFNSFRTHGSNPPVQIVVDHGGYFEGTTDMLLRGISKPITWRSVTVDSTEVAAEDLVTPLISGTRPGSSTLLLDCDHLLEHEDLKRFLPIGYTTVCCSQVERQYQFASRTAINGSCRHVGEVRMGGKSWTIRMVSSRALYIVTEAWYTVSNLNLPFSFCQEYTIILEFMSSTATMGIRPLQIL